MRSLFGFPNSDRPPESRKKETGFFIEILQQEAIYCAKTRFLHPSINLRH